VFQLAKSSRCLLPPSDEGAESAPSGTRGSVASGGDQRGGSFRVGSGWSGELRRVGESLGTPGAPALCTSTPGAPALCTSTPGAPALCTSRLLAGVGEEDAREARQRLMRRAAASEPLEAGEERRLELGSAGTWLQAKTVSSTGLLGQAAGSRPAVDVANSRSHLRILPSRRRPGARAQGKSAGASPSQRRASASADRSESVTHPVHALPNAAAPLNTPRRALQGAAQPLPSALCTSRLLASVEEEEEGRCRARLLRSRGGIGSPGGNDGPPAEDLPCPFLVRVEEGAREQDGWGMEDIAGADLEPPCSPGAPPGAARGQQYPEPGQQAQVPTGPWSEVVDEHVKEGGGGGGGEALFALLGSRRRVDEDAKTSDGFQWSLNGEHFHKSAAGLGTSVSGLIDLAGDDETHFHVLQNGMDFHKKLDRGIKGVFSSSVFFLEHLEENLHHSIETFGSPSKR